MAEKVNLAEKLGLFDDHWQPRIVARINDNDVHIMKVQGEFVWHKHDDSDDFFLARATSRSICVTATSSLTRGSCSSFPAGRAWPARRRRSGDSGHRTAGTPNHR
jgi:hypothetical protein